MNSLIASILPRVLQDLLTSAAAALVANGIITSDQETGFIGATFFLAMLIVNGVLHHTRAVAQVEKGANAVGGTLSPGQASYIAKTRYP